MQHNHPPHSVRWPVAFTAAILAGLVLSACGSGLYELPEPPPREEWRRHSLSPAENEAISREHFLAAKDSVLRFIEALDEERYEDAYMLLSNETRILLDSLSPTGLGEAVLREGMIQRGEAEYTVDPTDLFVIRNLQDIVDTYQDRPEAETYRRKEVYALSLDSDVHHVVLIFEEDQWHIHKPEIELTPGAPGRRAPSE